MGKEIEFKITILQFSNEYTAIDSSVAMDTAGNTCYEINFLAYLYLLFEERRPAPPVSDRLKHLIVFRGQHSLVRMPQSKLS